MARAATKSNRAVAVEDATTALWAPWLTQGAFILTLVLAVARALMSETVREAFDVLPHSEAAPAGPSATATLILDALCCLPALLVLLRRAVDREYVIRWNWAQVLFALLAAWAAISFAWSTDRFVTAIAAANMAAAAALIWSTAQLVRSWLRLRIVAGMCLGLLMAYAAQGVIYRFVQHPDDIKTFEKNRDRILHERGMEPDSFQAQQFERKFRAGEMIGFHHSPNSFGAVIVLLLAASAGIAIQRYAGGDGAARAIVIALMCAPALIVLKLTSSLTAGGTVAIAGITLVLLSRNAVRNWIGRHATLAYTACVIAFILGVAAVVGHGVTHGSLPQDSLNFRWRYWAAAAQMIRAHPALGVGWGNFGPHYLAFRLPAAAEEVRDPHNFIVRGFAELGIVGGVLVLAWLARAAWELTRPIVPPATAAAPMSMIGGIATVIAIALGGVLVNMFAAIDWSQPQAYLMLEMFARLLWAALLFIGLMVATMRSTTQQTLDDRPAPWVLYGLLVGLGVFFVHNLMDFVLMEAGPLTLFAVVLGAALGVRTPSAAGQKKRRGVAIAALATASIAWVVGVVAMVIPVADAEQRARNGDDAIRSERIVQAAELYTSAAKTVPYNADYPYRAARAWMGVPGTSPENVKSMLARAIAIDPANVGYHRARAAYELSITKPDAQAVRADFDQILRLDPRNLLARIDYAEALEKLGDPKAAAEQYREALEVNDGYDKTEPKRLEAKRVTEYQERISKLSS